jgi:hypothetical protein
MLKYVVSIEIMEKKNKEIKENEKDEKVESK